jgi:hypothetical protein
MINNREEKKGGRKLLTYFLSFVGWNEAEMYNDSPHSRAVFNLLLLAGFLPTGRSFFPSCSCSFVVTNVLLDILICIKCLVKNFFFWLFARCQSAQKVRSFFGHNLKVQFRTICNSNTSDLLHQPKILVQA